MRFIQIFFITMSISVNAFSQECALNLWQNMPVPNSIPSTAVEQFELSDIKLLKNICNPSIQVYLPSKRNATKQAVVICPGGGYWVLAYDWEGTEIAKWLNHNGIAAIVLKYRLPEAAYNVIPYKSPLLDAQRAMRLVRSNAANWNIDPGQIGIMGFSAGGHLASTLSTHFDQGDPKAIDSTEKFSCKPNFSILIYPVITFTQKYRHQSSVDKLLGPNPPKDLLEYFSSELQVTSETPPAFLVHASDDDGVPVENSLMYYNALRANNVKAEMHLYPEGGHGFGLARDKGNLSGWADCCIKWLNSIAKK